MNSRITQKINEFIDSLNQYIEKNADTLFKNSHHLQDVRETASILYKNIVPHFDVSSVLTEGKIKIALPYVEYFNLYDEQQLAHLTNERLLLILAELQAFLDAARLVNINSLKDTIKKIHGEIKALAFQNNCLFAPPEQQKDSTETPLLPSEIYITIFRDSGHLFKVNKAIGKSGAPLLFTSFRLSDASARKSALIHWIYDPDSATNLNKVVLQTHLLRTEIDLHEYVLTLLCLTGIAMRQRDFDEMKRYLSKIMKYHEIAIAVKYPNNLFFHIKYLKLLAQRDNHLDAIIFFRQHFHLFQENGKQIYRAQQNYLAQTQKTTLTVKEKNPILANAENLKKFFAAEKIKILTLTVSETFGMSIIILTQNNAVPVELHDLFLDLLKDYIETAERKYFYNLTVLYKILHLHITETYNDFSKPNQEIVLLSFHYLDKIKRIKKANPHNVEITSQQFSLDTCIRMADAFFELAQSNPNELQACTEKLLSLLDHSIFLKVRINGYLIRLNPDNCRKYVSNLLDLLNNENTKQEAIIFLGCYQDIAEIKSQLQEKIKKWNEIPYEENVRNTMLTYMEISADITANLLPLMLEKIQIENNNVSSITYACFTNLIKRKIDRAVLFVNHLHYLLDSKVRKPIYYYQINSDCSHMGIAYLLPTVLQILPNRYNEFHDKLIASRKIKELFLRRKDIQHNMPWMPWKIILKAYPIFIIPLFNFMSTQFFQENNLTYSSLSETLKNTQDEIFNPVKINDFFATSCTAEPALIETFINTVIPIYKSIGDPDLMIGGVEIAFNYFSQLNNEAKELIITIVIQSLMLPKLDFLLKQRLCKILPAVFAYKVNIFTDEIKEKIKSFGKNGLTLEYIKLMDLIQPSLSNDSDWMVANWCSRKCRRNEVEIAKIMSNKLPDGIRFNSTATLKAFPSNALIDSIQEAAENNFIKEMNKVKSFTQFKELCNKTDDNFLFPCIQATMQHTNVDFKLTLKTIMETCSKQVDKLLSYKYVKIAKMLLMNYKHCPPTYDLNFSYLPKQPSQLFNLALTDFFEEAITTNLTQDRAIVLLDNLDQLRKRKYCVTISPESLEKLAALSKPKTNSAAQAARKPL